jgi:hypothetical protein
MQQVCLKLGNLGTYLAQSPLNCVIDSRSDFVMASIDIEFARACGHHEIRNYRVGRASPQYQRPAAIAQ